MGSVVAGGCSGTLPLAGQLSFWIALCRRYGWRCDVFKLASADALGGLAAFLTCSPLFGFQKTRDNS